MSVFFWAPYKMGCPSSSNYVGSYEQIHVTGFPCKWSWSATKELEKKSTNASPDSLVPLGAFFRDFVGRDTGDRFGLEKLLVYDQCWMWNGFQCSWWIFVQSPNSKWPSEYVHIGFRMVWKRHLFFLGLRGFMFGDGFCWCFQKGGNSMGST